MASGADEPRPEEPRPGTTAEVLAATEYPAEDCAVCFEVLGEAAGQATCPVRKLSCGHQFHHSCIAQWLLRNASCPLCKSDETPEEPGKELFQIDLSHQGQKSPAGQRKPCSGGRMPGPWIGAMDNPGFMATREWDPDDILECRMYDSSKQEQKMAIWRVVQVGERAHGRWLTATLEVVEDEHLKWWLTKGAGSGSERTFPLHICHGPLRTCRAHDAKDELSFHTDYLRMLDLKDIDRRRAAWWQVGAAKADFENFRKKLLSEAEKPDARGRRKEDDELSFSALASDVGKDKEKKPPEGEADVGLAKQLAELKRGVSREPIQRRKKDPQPEERGVVKLKEKEGNPYREGRRTLSPKNEVL
eukprot:s2830_g8.t1